MVSALASFTAVVLGNRIKLDILGHGRRGTPGEQEAGGKAGRSPA